jgi:hypothetical protein
VNGLLDALQDALARVVFAREALDLGEYGIVVAVLRDLEDDLAAAIARARREAA